MSLFETKTADNFIFDETVDPREQLSETTPFLKKNVSYVVDQQAGNGAYTSGEVIIDSQAIAASGNVIDWRNAYLAVPYVTKLNMALGTAVTWTSTTGGGTGLGKFTLALKNNSLLHSFKLEANGKTIVSATEGLTNLVNFKMHSTMTPAALKKDGAVVNYYPDSQGSVGDGGSDSYNTGNDPLSYDTTGDNAFQFNEGLIKRQNNFLPTANTAFMNADNAKEEGASWDYGTGSVPTSTTAADVSDIHFIAVIRLRDLHDYFDKHSLARGVSYRLTLRFNQAISTVVSTSTAYPFEAAQTITTTQTSGMTQPVNLCYGASSMLGRLSASAPTIVTSTVTSAIDTTANARFSGVRLYVPSYELNPTYQERLLAEQPLVKRNFMDFMTQTTQTYAGAGAAINVQVSTSATNPRALIVIPRWSQTATGNGGQGFYSDASPLSTVPGSTDGLLSLTNLQVKVGSSYVLPDRQYYTFTQFQDHVASIFALNGNETVQTSGLIDKKMFETNHRYYAFDLSRYPEAMTNLPQMVALECKNNTQKAVEVLCILLYSREVEFNLANGSMTITA
jgi:hypothetical protein